MPGSAVGHALGCFIAAAGFTVLPVAFDRAEAGGDPASGRQVFQSVCGLCHTNRPGQNAIGPTLFGVVGRQTGSISDYSYSPANKAAHLTWDEMTLDKYLEAPRAVIPSTKMTYAGLKDPARRADIIAYLETLK